MIRPIQMCSWHYDKEKDATIKEVKDYLPGLFNDEGFLIGIAPPLQAFSQPVATPAEAMKLVEGFNGTETL